MLCSLRLGRWLACLVFLPWACSKNSSAIPKTAPPDARSFSHVAPPNAVRPNGLRGVALPVRDPSSSVPKGFAHVRSEYKPKVSEPFSSQSDLDNLIHDFKQAWKPAIRNLPPVPLDGGPLAVGVRIELVKFQDLDEVAGTVTLVLDLMLCWSDDRLAYESDKVFHGPYSGNKFSLSPKLVWTPDIVVLNQVAQMEDMFNSDDTPVVITDDAFRKLTGVNVLWNRRLNIVSRCPIDMSQFPFDTQRCAIIIGSWASSRRQMLLIPQDAEKHDSMGSVHTSEFRVLNITATKRDVYMRNAAERFEEIQYDLVLERYPHFYIVNFILPMVSVTMLTIATMWMSNAGTRINSGTRLLLCIVQIMNITASWRPANDSDIWLDKFQSHCLALSMAAVLQSLVMDYLEKTGLYKMSWAPRSHVVDTLLRTSICLTTIVVFVADMCDLFHRKDPRGLYGAFHAHSSKLLVAFVCMIFMCLGTSSVFSTLWLVLPPALWKRMCCKGCSGVASGGGEESPHSTGPRPSLIDSLNVSML